MNKDITLEDLGFYKLAKDYYNDKNTIEYRKDYFDPVSCDNYTLYDITFDLTNHSICGNYKKDEQTKNAIYNKCKDLGWFDEK